MIKEGKMLQNYIIWESLALCLAILAMFSWSFVTDKPLQKFIIGVDDTMKNEQLVSN